jgi:hypothetical protein
MSAKLVVLARSPPPQLPGTSRFRSPVSAPKNSVLLNAFGCRFETTVCLARSRLSDIRDIHAILKEGRSKNSSGWTVSTLDLNRKIQRPRALRTRSFTTLTKSRPRVDRPSLIKTNRFIGSINHCVGRLRELRDDGIGHAGMAIARFYRDHGFVAIVPRLPAHGTVPAALTDVDWEDWMAATRLAVREARRRTEPSAPLHLVGFSNGGALALVYALDSIGDEKLSRPDRLVLISPMVGITRFARFSGLAGFPAILPAFAKAAWLGIVPEFNPFKYNSFPVNGARQSRQSNTVIISQWPARMFCLPCS